MICIVYADSNVVKYVVEYNKKTITKVVIYTTNDNIDSIRKIIAKVNKVLHLNIEDYQLYKNLKRDLSTKIDLENVDKIIKHLVDLIACGHDIDFNFNKKNKANIKKHVENIISEYKLSKLTNIEYTYISNKMLSDLISINLTK